MPVRPLPEPTYFARASDFRRWLERHHMAQPELVVGFHKVDSGRPSMSWSQAVDEALCFGWIDGVRKRIDEHRYLIRFTPRRAGSIWSLVNIDKVDTLTKAGRMHPAGLAAYARRSAKKSGVYAFEQAPLDFDGAQQRAFKAHAAAWRYFESTPPGYRRSISFWVLSAKLPATRERRFAALLQACAEQRRLR